MSRQHPMLTSFARRLRPFQANLAAAAAWQDPNPLLQLRSAELHNGRPAGEPRPPSPRRAR